MNFLQLEQGGNLLLNSGGGYLLLNNSTPIPPEPDVRGGGGVSYQDIERYIKFIEDMKNVGQKPTPEIIEEIKNIVEDVPIDLPKLAAITVEADFSGVSEELQRIQIYIDRLQLFINRAIMEKNNEEESVILALLM
jgi:hypothetical protein